MTCYRDSVEEYRTIKDVSAAMPVRQRRAELQQQAVAAPETMFYHPWSDSRRPETRFSPPGGPAASMPR
jgi:hypothetical protein